jgi:hypothetical protein
VIKIFPMANGVIEKARKGTAFRSKLSVVLTSQLNFETRESHPGIVCHCSQPVEDFSTRTFYSLFPENIEIYTVSVPFCDIPEHSAMSMQVANSYMTAEAIEQRFHEGREAKNCVFNFCARCEQGGKEKKMKYCSRCGVYPYCSRECQKVHWKEHKKVCTPSAERTVP